MLHSLLLISIFILVISLAIPLQASAVITPQDNAADKQITNFISNVAENKHNNISQVIIKKFNDSSSYILNREYLKPTTPPPTQPPTEPPTEPPVTSIPVVNTSTTLRIASVGDIDNNAGLTTQVNLAKKHGAQYFVIPGDYAYNSASGVQSKVKTQYAPDKTVVAVGNHDSCSNVKSWVSVSTCFYIKSIGNTVDFFVIDSNTNFGCTGTQYEFFKNEIANSDATYKIVVLHHPFVTVKSDHGSNGQFNCFNEIFQNEDVDVVAQAHNHNYQIVKIDKTWYGVFGTGTHDSGSSMYGCDSTTFNNIPVKCITGTNGVEFIDLDLTQKSVKGYFVSNADKLVHSFGVN